MTRGKESLIFGKAKINFTPNYPLTHLCASNNRLVIAMQNKVLLRIDLSSNPVPEEIDLKKQSLEAKILNLFLDPYGEHLLLGFSPRDSTNPAETIYLGPSSTKPKEIPKLWSHIITAVAWLPYKESSTSSPTSTSPFLLGTSKGLIFEGEIANSEVKISKQLFDIGKGNAAVISGLEYFFVPNTNKCFILVATARKIYQFKGFISNKDDRPWFSNIFNSYLSQSSSEEALEFGELTPYMQTDQSISRLSILYDPATAYPKVIGYLTDTGSMVFKDVTASPVPLDNFLNEIKLLPYPKIPPDSDNSSTATSPSGNKVPRSLVMTNYHAVMLFRNCVKAICTLNEDVIFEDNFGKSEDKVVSFTRDPIKGLIWFFTERSVHKYIITGEDRNVWKIYLDKDNFTKAEESCKGDLAKMEQISMRQAGYWFNRKEYEKSAMYYALTSASFEEIALKFVQIDNSQALKTFLMKKLSSLQQYDTTQISVLVLWIVELYLNELGSLRDFGKNESAEYHNLEEDFLQFMKQKIVKDCVTKNKKAVYDLMASHGDKQNLIHFTLVMQDFYELIENSINNGQHHAALTTLQKQKDTSLYSKFIPILLDKDPKATIDVLISSGRMLSPIKLLPKFSAKLDADTAREIVRYLEHCVNVLGITDQPVHDYLVSLYINFNPIEKLMRYLELQGNAVDRVRYDPKYCLMMCLEKKLHIPTIHLYTLMGLYEEAVALAIQIDLELAKKTANMPENDEELRKKLWLRIAKHVVKEKNDIQQAMEFLGQCELLKIEDILPFFPNFVTIDHFKDAICSSLQEYNRHIQTLKEEMEEATKSAEIIREEIQGVRNRCAIVRATDECTLCGVPLLIRNFYVFPCGHQFHSDCLRDKVTPQLSNPRKALLLEYTNKLRDMNLRHDVQSTGSDAISARDQIKSDIDDIVASECLYCGDSMIKLIDAPFIAEDDYDKVQKEWV